MTALKNVFPQHVEAYLDIETTGLSPTYDEITVVGIHLCSETDAKFIQLVGRGFDKSREKLWSVVNTDQ